MTIRDQINALQTERPCRRCGLAFNANLTLCPVCQFWNSDGLSPQTVESNPLVRLSDVKSSGYRRLVTGPWDSIFGDSKNPGIVDTGVTLLGGKPGSGKSTMSLQLADCMATSTGRDVIYIGAEESPEEIAERGRRLELKSMHLICVYPMGSNVPIVPLIYETKPCGIVLDSLQGFTSDPAGAEEICKSFKPISVDLKAPTIIISQVTKDEDFAGFMKMQHAVDTTVMFSVYEDEIRELEIIKNRYGPAGVKCTLLMGGNGLTWVSWTCDCKAVNDDTSLECRGCKSQREIKGDE